MKIFTSAIESACMTTEHGKLYLAQYMNHKGIRLLWNLMSYYYLQNHADNAEYIRDNSDLILIYSGAHSFQFGKKVEWEQYTRQYAEWIRRFDRKNVVGYFEMDIENIVGYERVLELRKILEDVSDKIIPVWHPLRGIDDYEKMCEQYRKKVVAIGGFRGTDIKDDQYLMFMKVARKYDCKVHCLGMSRENVLSKCPFDYTDSATWLTAANMGDPIINGKRSQKTSAKRFPKAKGIDKLNQYAWNYRNFQAIQMKYYRKWQKECKD